MLRYECDSCHLLKESGEEWILGLAAENIGAVSARREIAFEPEWDDGTATHPLAVHFCSVECKDNYIKSLFGNTVAVATAAVPIPREASTRGARGQQRPRKRA
jgi:hypothetical protein